MGGAHDGVYLVVEGEHRVLRRILLGAGHNHAVEEGNVLGACHLVVAVGIAQGKDVIVARGNVAKRELPKAVGAAHALQRQRGERRVVEVAVKAHEHVAHGLQVAGTQHDARHLQRVHMVAGGEGKAKAVEHVGLVVVFDGVGEVYHIGGAWQEVFLKLHSDFLALSPDGGLLFRGGRHHHAGGLVLDVDNLVEVDLHLLALEVHRSRRGIAAQHHRRGVVARTALGVANVGARSHRHRHQQQHRHVICKPQ